ncbi:MAG: serine/threonine-protein kinase [Pirellulaceae bacterium]|nr:serine/threonine protein kinase [Planctomycetaceae bacterium]
MGVFDKIRDVLGGTARLNVNERFEVLRAAVSGTMSKFYMARERATGDIYGLKIADREKVDLFENRFKGLKKPSEGEIAAQINHPLVVKTYEHGLTTDGIGYVLMEFVGGSVLQTLVYNKEPKIIGNRLKLVRQMAEAIAAVHKSGFIHRDVCPRNFICTDATASDLKLIDFGLTLPALRPFMQPGNRTGTPLYMAPEVIRRRWTDQRLDIFAFGVTAYHICTFELPWPVSETSGLAALDHDTKEPKDIFDLNVDLHRTLGKAIMRCIEPDVNKRTASMEVFLQQIRRVESELETK